MNNDEHFTSRTDWYKTKKGADVAKKRFIGYLAGGDEDAAREKLNNLGIVDGIDGVSFETDIEGEELTVTIKYEIQYWFDFFGAGKIPMEQTIKSRLWMKEN